MLAALGAGAVYAAALVEARWRPSVSVRRSYAASQVGVLVAAAAVAVAAYGTPPQMAHSLRQAFDAPNTHAVDSTRLLSLSLADRTRLWSAAWADGKSHMLRGGGIGSFEQYWFKTPQRPPPTPTPHTAPIWKRSPSWGLAGCSVLATTLLTPLVAGIRARRHPGVPAAIGAYVAYLVHTGVDWDWLLPALTLAALFTACALLSADAESQPAIHRSAQWVLAGTGLVVALVATFGLIGNRQLSAAYAAAGRGDFSTAVVDARSAARWQPWSYLPWLTIGSAERALDNPTAARHAYQTAVKRDRGRWDAWFGLASISSGQSAHGVTANGAPPQPAVAADREILPP